MKLELENSELAAILNAEILQIRKGYIINSVICDTRAIINPLNLAFFALVTDSDDGHNYVKEAYALGVRTFIISTPVNLPEDTSLFLVKDCLVALQNLAFFHRSKFSLPVIAITGSYGKTIAKEWLYFLLKDEFKIVRSPKSYNSQLGVALSLLEINESHTLGIFEVGISKPNEMDILERIVDPTLGFFTGLGKAHSTNFSNEKQHLSEKIKLFKHSNFVFTNDKFRSVFRRTKLNGVFVSKQSKELAKKANTPFLETLSTCIETAFFFGLEPNFIEAKLEYLPFISSRLEVIAGSNNTVLLNDTYSLDESSLRMALTFLVQQKEKEKKYVVLDDTELSEAQKEGFLTVIDEYEIDEVFFVTKDTYKVLHALENASILFKGNYNSALREIVNQLAEKKHQTWLEVNQTKITENLNILKSKLNRSTKILVMLKASSYGSGDVKMAHFLEQRNVDYFGVAYADEGVALRESEIETPILVMNAEKDALQDIITFNLEPAIYSFNQLETFINVLIRAGKKNFPIHLKVETGMNRLGFLREDLEELMAKLATQPEVYVKSIFSHLATANSDEVFVAKQTKVFNEIANDLLNGLDEKPWLHILNSEGVLRYPRYQMDMVRIGIAMYGIGSDNNLKGALSWFTRISQVKKIKSGDSVGYGRTFVATKKMHIAIIPVGYSDGYRRILGNGVGSVFINNHKCSIIGSICMDMCMIDVSDVVCSEGDVVELLGPNITIEDLAIQMQTIPYEVMTGISKRVPRVYIEET